MRLSPHTVCGTLGATTKSPLMLREAFTNFAEVEDGYRVRYPDGYESWSPLRPSRRRTAPLST